MKKKLALIISAISIIAFSSCTINRVQKPSRTVTVSGTGIVTAKPDQAVICLAAETFSRDVIQATNANADIMTKIQNDLVAQGFAKDSISTADFQITQDTINRNGIIIRGDYRVTNSIYITLKNIDKVGSAIDTAVKAGANKLSYVNFMVTNQAELIRQARTEAVKNAADAANLMAGTSGAVLGEVLSIEEISSPVSATRSKKVNAMYLDATPISAGDAEVSVTVSCTYALQ